MSGVWVVREDNGPTGRVMGSDWEQKRGRSRSHIKENDKNSKENEG